MPEVGGAALLCGVIRLVDDNIQIASQDGSILAKLLKVKSTILDELGESQRPEVADRRLLRGGELDDFGAATSIMGLRGLGLWVVKSRSLAQRRKRVLKFELRSNSIAARRSAGLVLSFAARSAFAAVAQRVERRPCFVCVRCPMIVDVALVGQYLETLVAVRPGNDRKFPFLTARRNVDLTGDPTVAWRYSMRFLVDGRS
jgi:hypothetical protein